jgi:hypothetical protein
LADLTHVAEDDGFESKARCGSKNIFICSGVVFCGLCPSQSKEIAMRLRMKANGAISMVHGQTPCTWSKPIRSYKRRTGAQV